MKHLILLALLVTTNAFADRKGAPFHPHDDKRFDEIEDQLEDTTEAVGLARKSARFVYDVAVDGGSSTGNKSLGVVIPAGSIITALHLYINTLFADSGTGSVGLGCGGNRDLMNWKDLTLVSQDSFASRVLNAVSSDGSSIMDLNNQWATAASKGASVNTACTVTAVVRGDAGFVEQTAGKLTGVIEYFSR